MKTAELIRRARAAGACQTAFNVYDTTTMTAVFEAVRETGKPAILAFGEAYERHMPLETVAVMARSLEGRYGFSLPLHLDHCESLETIRRAIRAGFDSVMLDGSRFALDENIRMTRQAAVYAHAAGVGLEGELGGMNPEDGSPDDEFIALTDPEQAERFVQETGVDWLAVSVGNAHGLYRFKPQLRLALIRDVYARTRIPLALHGCSGIPMAQLTCAAQAAVAKINVNTEVAIAGANALRQMLVKDECAAPVKLNQLLPVAQTAMKEAMLPYFDLSHETLTEGESI